MTSDPPEVAIKAWKVRVGSLLSVSVEGGWYRGLVVTRLNQTFSIYLVDLGHTVTATLGDLRPLTSLLEIPPYAHQVEEDWGSD